MHPGGKLIIETPEQTAVEFNLAGIGSRALALLIDSALQAGALIVLGIVAGLISYAGFFPQMGKQWTYAILTLIAFLIEFAYFAFFEATWNGQTPGKRRMHLRVIMDSGRPVDPQGAILRNLLRVVDSLPSLYAVGIVTSLLNAQNKRLGDYLAGTVVVHERAAREGNLPWETSAAPSLAAVPPRQLTPDELQLVEAFLDRRPSFTDEVRRSMARQIAERLSPKPVPVQVLHEPEKFLESLVDQNRNALRFR